MSEMIWLKIKKLKQDAIIPQYSTKGSVAFDISSLEKYALAPDRLIMVHTGLAVAIPEGYEMNVRARSGLSLKYPNYVAIAGGGTVDSDYRGEIIVPVYNHTDETWVIEKGDRIAQCIVSPIVRCLFDEVIELDETERNTGGFGSTGK